MKKLLIIFILGVTFVLGGCLGTSDNSESGESIKVQKAKFNEIINMMAAVESKRSTGGVQNGIYIYNLENSRLDYYSVSYLLELTEDQTVGILSDMYNAYEVNKVSLFSLSGNALEYSGLGGYTGASSFSLPISDFIQNVDVVYNVGTNEEHYADGAIITKDNLVKLQSDKENVVGSDTFIVSVSAESFATTVSAFEFTIEYDSTYMEYVDGTITVEGVDQNLELVSQDVGTITVAVTTQGEGYFDINQASVSLGFAGLNNSGKGMLSFGEIEVLESLEAGYISGVNIGLAKEIEFSSSN